MSIRARLYSANIRNQIGWEKNLFHSRGKASFTESPVSAGSAFRYVEASENKRNAMAQWSPASGYPSATAYCTRRLVFGYKIERADRLCRLYKLPTRLLPVQTASGSNKIPIEIVTPVE